MLVVFELLRADGRRCEQEHDRGNGSPGCWKKLANPIADEAGAEARFSISYSKDRLRVCGEVT
jgi:hypothetical protein